MIGFYFDEHLPRAVSKGLIERGYSVVMAVDVGMQGKDDDTQHLPYATLHQLVLVTFDHPFAGRTVSRTDFFGFVCLDESLKQHYGAIIDLLILAAEAFDVDKDTATVIWLP